jgi:hypothetical protein
VRFTRRTGASRRKCVKRRVPSAPTLLPSVTVVVPAYNYGRFLVHCAESVLAQRDVEVKLLVMDDGSTDETPQVTEKLAASDARVTVIRTERNRGQLPTVNEAFGRVESEYVVKLDADDLLPPGSLARAIALLQAHPKVAFVYGRPHHFSGGVPTLPDSRTRSWTIWSGQDWLAARCRCGACVISQPEVVMRTSFLRRAIPVREDLPHTFDMHLWMQLASLGDVGRINGPVQGLYRVHEASMQRTIHSGIMIDLEGRRAAFDALFNAEARNCPRARELLATAHQSLASTALDDACRAYDRGRTSEKPVNDLVAFAIDTFPEARQLKEWRALERRRAVGADRAHRRPRFFAAALARRTAEEISHSFWLRTGEW